MWIVCRVSESAKCKSSPVSKNSRSSQCRGIHRQDNSVSHRCPHLDLGCKREPSPQDGHRRMDSSGVEHSLCLHHLYSTLMAPRACSRLQALGRAFSRYQRNPHPQASFSLLHLLCVQLSEVSNSVWPHGPTRLLCPWDSPGKNTGVGCLSLLQGIFLNHGPNACLLHLLHWEVNSLPLAPLGKLTATEKFIENKSRSSVHPGTTDIDHPKGSLLRNHRAHSQPDILKFAVLVMSYGSWSMNVAWP